jgi:Protein of unknown function (DUF4058)
MPSPFPGMNPYLERHDMWADFHDRLLVEVSNSLIRQVRPHYVVKIEEYVYLHQLDDEEADRERVGRPDLGVMANRPPTGGWAVAVLDAPAVGTVPPEVELVRIPYLEVRDRADRTLVTAIELLSPSNKSSGEDRDQHEVKWRRLLASSANVVEIDLLRGGERMPWVGLPPCDYLVTVSRREQRPQVGFWPVRLRDPLPNIPVPLRPGQPEPRLDLQALLHKVYDDAGYEDHIYEAFPEPRLPPPDDAWAADLARAATAPAPRP